MILASLYEFDGAHCHWLAGVNLIEVLDLIGHDYDEVDRLYVDLETIGGG